MTSLLNALGLTRLDDALALPGRAVDAVRNGVADAERSLAEAMGEVAARVRGATADPVARLPAETAAAPAARIAATTPPDMKTLVARFKTLMARIVALELANAPEAAELMKAAVAAGNLSTNAKGIVLSNNAFDAVEAKLAAAERKASVATMPPEAEQPATKPPAETAPPAAAGDTAKPEFKGYPSTLEKSEKLIKQVKKYGFHEGIHATSMDAADRRDTEEIWCSGLSNWALAEEGFDLDAPIPGKQCFKKVQKKNKKTGKMEWVTVPRPVTLRGLVEGDSMNFAETPEEAVEDGKNSYAEAGLFGATAAEDDPRVKGAAGAFVFAGIGKEITDLEDVKPGDFAQTREVGAPNGHAFQIHACQCEGECLVGPANSPTLVKDLGGAIVKTAAGEWHEKASFKIDGSTSPLLVGMHKVVKSDWLESNVAGAMEDKTDKDGGVQVRHGRKFEDPAQGGKRTYIGRLSSSSWAGYARAAAPLQRPEPRA